MQTNEVAALLGVAPITARKWAAENGVSYIGEGQRKTYLWNESDIERFRNRKGPGWEKGKSRKGE
jgi:predicted site-specific integrase-resolvase